MKNGKEKVRRNTRSVTRPPTRSLALCRAAGYPRCVNVSRLRYKGIKVCFRFVCREGPEHGRACARLSAIWDQESVRVERPPNAIARDFWSGREPEEKEKEKRESKRENHRKGRDRRRERRKDGKGGEKKKEGGRGSEWRKRENARGGSRERRKAKREGIWARNACRVINAPRYARSLWIWPNQWPIALPFFPLPVCDRKVDRAAGTGIFRCEEASLQASSCISFPPVSLNS